jgi:hypothetical protein
MPATPVGALSGSWGTPTRMTQSEGSAPETIEVSDWHESFLYQFAKGLLTLECRCLKS